jgi:hypothetical protein
VTISQNAVWESYFWLRVRRRWFALVMSKTNDLVQDLIAALDASPLGRDEKIKAMSIARNHLNNPVFVHAVGRNSRAPVGTGKKTQALLDTMAEQEKERAKKKSSRKAPRN